MRVLDIDNVARIGLMYIDGDKFENVMTDKFSLDYDDVNYIHDDFNELKIALLKLERINPDLDISTVLWQLRPDNSNLAVPVIAGGQGRRPAHLITPVNPEMKHVFTTGESAKRVTDEGFISHYYALRDSENRIVGVLEIRENV